MPNRNEVLAFALDRWSRSCHSRHWKLLESHRWTSLCSTKDLQTQRPLWCFPQWGSFCLFGDGRMKLTRFISLPWRILDPSRLRYGLPSGRVWDSREFWAACVKIDVRGRLNMEPGWSLMMKQMLLILQGLKCRWRDVSPFGLRSLRRTWFLGPFATTSRHEGELKQMHKFRGITEDCSIR